MYPSGDKGLSIASQMFQKRDYYFSRFHPDVLHMANEASGTQLSKHMRVNMGDTPMQIVLMTDKVIEAHRLKEVTDTIMFDHGDVPRDGGLFSERIFGTMMEDRRWTCGYIDLGQRYFHPYVFEVMEKLSRNVDQCAQGKGTWAFRDGRLEKTKEGDADYDPDAYGIDWLIAHYKEFNIPENKSYIHNEYVRFLKNLSEDEWLISKWIVLPVFYRDVDFSGGARQVPQLNYRYRDLLRYAKVAKQPSIGNVMTNAKWNIQTALIAIRKYGESLISHKSGFLKQASLGKTTDYAARSVITQPNIAKAQRPEDMIVDINHTGFPIATCCSMAYPLIEYYIQDFFSKEFETKQKKNVLRPTKNGGYELVTEAVGDVMAKYNSQYIEKNVEQFIGTYGARFTPLTIPMADGTETYMLFVGKPYGADPKHPNVPGVGQRPMTWTDLLYIACVEMLEKPGYMSYVTRYPLVDYFGTFPSGIRVTSTFDTVPMEVNGVRYPHYPVVDFNATQDDASTKFIDAVMLDNVYLEGLGGDYDGDTISEKTVFTQEANEEARDIMNSKTHFISINGDLVRKIANEAYLTFFSMTRDDNYDHEVG